VVNEQTRPALQVDVRRPTRADARRNFDALLGAARDAFAGKGADASLEDIARQAGVGIGTLYRNFPNRQSLLEAVYAGEVENLSRSAAAYMELEPWEGFVAWVQALIGYMATKHALAHELFEYVDRDAPLFQSCRTLLFASGEPLLARAQEAGAVRHDTDIAEVIQIVGGISKIPAVEPEQIEHIIEIALDGLRFRG